MKIKLVSGLNSNRPRRYIIKGDTVIGSTLYRSMQVDTGIGKCTLYYKDKQE